MSAVRFDEAATLLRKVSTIARHSEALARLRHENFNLFSLLRKEHDEEHLHSAFIAELLDPRGSHDMGDTFTRLFFQHIGGQVEPTEVISVATEKPLPGGRADIYLRSGSFEMIIENKLYAADQTAQLARYHRYLQTSSGTKLRLYYLTLDGTPPSSGSTTSVDGGDNLTDEDYTCLSYREDILKWITACHQTAADHPPLRESLKMYLTLLKKITHQLTDQQSMTEIDRLIQDNLYAASLINQQFQLVRRRLVAEFVSDLVKMTLDKLGGTWHVTHELDSYEELVGKNYGKIDFHPGPGTESWRITVEGHQTMLHDKLCVGVFELEANHILKQSDFVTRCRKRNKWWLALDDLLDTSDMDTLQVLSASGTRNLVTAKRRTEFLKSHSDRLEQICSEGLRHANSQREGYNH